MIIPCENTLEVVIEQEFTQASLKHIRVWRVKKIDYWMKWREEYSYEIKMNRLLLLILLLIVKHSLRKRMQN